MPAPRRTSRGPTASELIVARIRTVIDVEEDGNVAQAARKMNISQRGLQKVYSGATRDPRASLISRMAGAYNLDPSWILTGVKRGSPGSIKREARRLAREMVLDMANSVAEAKGITIASDLELSGERQSRLER
jgi:transcriptional regulator with XRE-family HTH domain